MLGSHDRSDGGRRGSKSALLFVCCLVGVLLVNYKSGAHDRVLPSEARLKTRSDALSREGSELRAIANAQGMAQKLARATPLFVKTAKAHLAQMKEHARTFKLDRPSTSYQKDPAHYPDVPKPPRPLFCRRGFHATILGCGDGYGTANKPVRGFKGHFWDIQESMEVLPNFAELGEPGWIDYPTEINYDADKFKAVAKEGDNAFPELHFAARWEGFFEIELYGYAADWNSVKMCAIFCMCGCLRMSQICAFFGSCECLRMYKS